MKRLLVDTINFRPSGGIITETLEDENGKMVVKGVLQRAGAKNQNGRIYPKDILLREAEKYLAGPVKENRAMGELDHPDSGVVNLKNVSHNIKKLWWDNDDLYGEIEVLATPSGNIVKELLKAGITVGISSRGMGSVREIFEDNAVVVEDDFNLICWDFVSEPSTHGAFMHPVHEGMLAEGVVLNEEQRYNRVNKIISDIMCDGFGSCICEFKHGKK